MFSPWEVQLMRNYFAKHVKEPTKHRKLGRLEGGHYEDLKYGKTGQCLFSQMLLQAKILCYCAGL